MSTAPLATLTNLPLNERNAQSIIDLVVEASAATTLRGAGTGYVICAGGRYAKYGYATCRWIREVLKDDAPIEWWLGANETAAGTRALEISGVSLKVADIPGGWPLKARAVLNSRFQRAILLDADCLPMVKAADAWTYAASGALFFPDIGNHRKSDWGYAALKIRAGSIPEMEAGQVIVDRVRHAQAVFLVDYFNQHPEFFYQHHLGDKDLWGMAFARLKIPFSTGLPCENKGWGLRHFLPDGTHYSDHLIHIKNGQSCPHPEYQGYLEDFDKL